MKVPDPLTARSVIRFRELIGDKWPISELWLYGSRARGDAREDSDADIAVILEGPKGRTTTVSPQMAGVAYDIWEETGIIVSPVAIWRDDWNDPSGHGNPYLIEAIKQEGIRFA